ncbi:hypothetical protein K0651_01845 [Ornithinimicrobium sp. Arc0846-15]|nr:hypothetical protein [Ornithinimicrobium laminariae]
MHHELGLDLLDFFRGKHSWEKLLRLIKQIPAHSKYGAARADDPELADHIMSLPASARKWSPPYEDWTPEVSALANIEDQLSHISAQIEAARGGRPSRPKPVPRPVTAVDRAESAARNQRHDELVDEVVQAQARIQAA